MASVAPANPADSGGTSRSPGSGAGWALVALLKMIAVFGGLWGAFRLGWLRPLPLVGGYLCLVLGVVTAALTSDKARRSDL